MKWVCRDFGFVESGNEDKGIIKETRVEETRIWFKKRQKKRRKKRRFGFDCKYEMIQKVKRKEEDKRERDETRGREKKKKTFALCCFLFFLFSFCHFIMGFK